MVPAVLEIPPDETEFDLDVRLQAVARDLSAERGQRATEITCVAGCSQHGEFTCKCN